MVSVAEWLRHTTNAPVPAKVVVSRQAPGGVIVTHGSVLELPGMIEATHIRCCHLAGVP